MIQISDKAIEEVHDINNAEQIAKTGECNFFDCKVCERRREKGANMGKNKPKIEYYPIYKPLIKVAYPEFADVMDALKRSEDTLDEEIEIARDTAWALYAIAARIEEKAVRDYYTGVIRKWLNTEPKPPEHPASS